jgi:hypothetical protein
MQFSCGSTPDVPVFLNTLFLGRDQTLNFLMLLDAFSMQHNAKLVKNISRKRYRTRKWLAVTRSVAGRPDSRG